MGASRQFFQVALQQKFLSLKLNVMRRQIGIIAAPRL